MSMKKILCALLSVLMLTVALIGCQTNEEGTPETSDVVSESETQTQTQTEIETNEYGDIVINHDVPIDELDYKGAEVVIASRPEDRYRREYAMDADKRKDQIDARVYKRNLAVEKELGVKIKVRDAKELWTTDGITTFVTTESSSGSNAVDIISAYAAFAVTPALRGYYVNLLSNDMTYMDTTKGYWNQRYVKAATCYDQLYYIIGDMNLTVYDKSIVTFVNMTMAEELDYDPDDLYEKVLNNEWTIDYFYQICQEVGLEEGDNIPGASKGDIVAVSSISDSEAYDGFLAAFDFQLLTENEDGSHSANVEGNVRLEDAADKLKDLYALPGAYVVAGTDPSFEMFRGNQSLFLFEILYRNADKNTALREVTWNYGILPLPKYDEDQDHYLTTPQDAYNTMSVMNKDSDRLEVISAVLELMTAKSYADVRPFYIEKVVKTKYVDGAKPVKMLDIIFEGASFDTAAVYHGQVNGMCIGLWRNVIKNNGLVSQKWESVRDATLLAIDDFDIWFEATAG